MRRRLAIAVLAAVLAAPSCRADDPVVFDLSIRGIWAGTLSFTGEAKEGRYAVSGRLESAGLVGLVRQVRYDGQAEGSLRQGRFTPARYSEQADTERRQSQSVMEYRRGIPQVKVYNPTKTVVDCFRYRRHVGLDVALEAMREVLRRRRCTPDAIARCATKCGVASVVRPYLEAMA